MSLSLTAFVFVGIVLSAFSRDLRGYGDHGQTFLSELRSRVDNSCVFELSWALESPVLACSDASGLSP